MLRVPVTLKVPLKLPGVSHAAGFPPAAENAAQRLVFSTTYTFSALACPERKTDVDAVLVDVMVKFPFEAVTAVAGTILLSRDIRSSLARGLRIFDLQG